MADQPWYTSPAGWWQELGSTIPAIPGYGTARRLGARLPIEPLFDVLTPRLVGKRIETRLGGSPLTFTVTGLDTRFDPIGAALGQADEVAFTAGDVEFEGLSATRVAVHPRNVHTRLSLNPTLVAAPVDVVVETNWDQVQLLLQRHLGQVDVEPLGEQRARLRPTGERSRRGWVDVDVAVVDGRVELRPTAAGWGESLLRRRVQRIPAIPLPTALGDGVRIVDVRVAPESVRAVLRVDEWSIAYTRLLSF